MLLFSCITINSSRSPRTSNGRYTPQSGKGVNLSIHSFPGNEPRPKVKPSKHVVRTGPYSSQEYFVLPEKYRERMEEEGASK